MPTGAAAVHMLHAFTPIHIYIYIHGNVSFTLISNLIYTILGHPYFETFPCIYIYIYIHEYITCPARAGETQERQETDTLPATESEVKAMLKTKGKEVKKTKAPKDPKGKKDKKCKDKKGKGGKSKKSVTKKLKKDKKDKKVKKGKSAVKGGKPLPSKSCKPSVAKRSTTPASEPVRRDLAMEMLAVATPQVAATQLDSQADPKNDSKNVVGLVNWCAGNWQREMQVLMANEDVKSCIVDAQGWVLFFENSQCELNHTPDRSQFPLRVLRCPERAVAYAVRLNQEEAVQKRKTAKATTTAEQADKGENSQDEEELEFQEIAAQIVAEEAKRRQEEKKKAAADAQAIEEKKKSQEAVTRHMEEQAAAEECKRKDLEEQAKAAEARDPQEAEQASNGKLVENNLLRPATLDLTSPPPTPLPSEKTEPHQETQTEAPPGEKEAEAEMKQKLERQKERHRQWGKFMRTFAGWSLMVQTCVSSSLAVINFQLSLLVPYGASPKEPPRKHPKKSKLWEKRPFKQSNETVPRHEICKCKCKNVLHVYAHLLAYIYTYVYIYIHTHPGHMCVCTHICTYIYIYIQIYIMPQHYTKTSRHGAPSPIGLVIWGAPSEISPWFAINSLKLKNAQKGTPPYPPPRGGGSFLALFLYRGPMVLLGDGQPLQELFEQWILGEEDWRKSQVHLRISNATGKVAAYARDWLTEEELANKVGQKAAESMIAFLEGNCPEKIRDHPDAPGIKETLGIKGLFQFIVTPPCVWLNVMVQIRSLIMS